GAQAVVVAGTATRNARARRDNDRGIPGPWGGGGDVQSRLALSSALSRFFSGALLDCLAAEKAEVMDVHLRLCHAVVTARWTLNAPGAWSLRLALDYGRGSALQTKLAEGMRAAAATAAMAVAGPGAIGSVGESLTGSGSGPERGRRA
ncbi:unnamed protein product, partial [Discosporangium mesarthrocarpum]